MRYILRLCMLTLTMLLAACGAAPAVPVAEQPTTAPVAAAPTEAPPQPSPTAEFTGTKDQITLVALYEDPVRIFEHPWYEIIKEYNASNPEVEVVLSAGLSYDALATMILASNPPDLIHMAIGGIFDRIPHMPNAVNVDQWLTDADRADFGLSLDAVRHPTKPDHTLGFPIELRLEPQICANVDVFEKAGVDWQKIAKEGWTWDEFITAAQQMTVDANGKHPNEDGFDPKNVVTWGSGDSMSGLPWTLQLAMMNSGVPQATVIQWVQVGGIYDLGPEAAEAAQWLHDWIFKYQIVDPETYKLGDDFFDQSIQRHVEGKAAVTAFGGGFCDGGVNMINDKIRKGELAGTEVNARLRSLPLPYNSKYMEHEAYGTQALYLQVMKQEPYKGDAHTENVVKFAQWFSSAELQTRILKEFESRGLALPIPARASVRDAIITDPARLAEIEYMSERVRQVPPLAHPANVGINTQVAGPLTEKFLTTADMTGEQFVEELKTNSQPLLDEWVNQAKPEDEALIAYVCQLPDWWPGPMYPNFKPRVSDACTAKLQELGIE